MSEIEAAVRRIVAEMMGERLPSLVAEVCAKVSATPAGTLSPLVDIRGACEFLRVSETKLRGMCRANAIPFHKLDGSYRFDLEELHRATKACPRPRAAN